MTIPFKKLKVGKCFRFQAYGYWYEGKILAIKTKASRTLAPGIYCLPWRGLYPNSNPFNENPGFFETPKHIEKIQPF